MKPENREEIQKRVKRFCGDTLKLIKIYFFLFLGAVLIYSLLTRRINLFAYMIFLAVFLFMLLFDYKKCMVVMNAYFDQKRNAVIEEKIEVTECGIDKAMNYQYRSKGIQYVGDTKYVLVGKKVDGSSVRLRFAYQSEMPFDTAYFSKGYQKYQVRYLERSRILLSIRFDREQKEGSVKIVKGLKEVLKNINQYA